MGLTPSQPAACHHLPGLELARVPTAPGANGVKNMICPPIVCIYVMYVMYGMECNVMQCMEWNGM